MLKIPPVFLAPWLLLADSKFHHQQQKQEIQLSSARTRQSPICEKGIFFIIYHYENNMSGYIAGS